MADEQATTGESRLVDLERTLDPTDVAQLRRLARVWARLGDMERAARRSRDAERGQFGLFGDTDETDDAPLEECETWSTREELGREKEALGFFLTGHPLEKFKNILAMMRP